METNEQEEYFIKKMANQLISQIQRDIQSQLLSPMDNSAHTNQVLHKSEKKEFTHNKSSKSMHLSASNVQQLKKEKLRKLKKLQLQEDMLKKSTFLTSSNVSGSISKLFKSQYTEEQMQKIKAILKKQKQFAKQLQDKEKQLAQYISEKHKQDQQLKQKILIQKCEERKIQLRKQREQLQKKRQERKANFQTEIKKLKELKEKKLLHQTMEEKFQSAIKQVLEQKEKAYEQERQRKKNVVQDIEQHQKKYLQLKKQKEIQRSQSLTKSKLELPTLKSKIWLKVQKNQQSELKIKEWEENLKDQHLNKRKLYSKQIKQLFFPKLKPQSNLVVREEISEARKGLKLQQQHKRGNDYMKTAHQSITELHLQKLKKSLEKVDNLGGHSAFYKNYLSEIKSESRHEQIELTSSAFQQTAADENLPHQQKLNKLKKMLEMKERKMPKNADSQMIDVIKSKLLVLKEMIR